jgi:predicted tellurium resistance membrane protein TerC
MVTVVFAYLVMCLDNILAIAAVGQDHPALLALGLTMSCVLLIPGSLVIAELMKRYPLLVRIGAGVLGWTGGTMVAAALPVLGDRFSGPMAQFLVPVLTAATVVSSPSWWPTNRECDAAGEHRRSSV